MLRNKKAKPLCDLINRPKGVFAFGVASAIDAIAAEKAGIECIYAGGYSAAGLRGWPDMGILSGPEMVDHIRLITKATSLPVVADIDDGYGSVHNVVRTVTDLLETTSVAGFHLEDQRYPKRCGHIAGKEVIPIDEFAGKLRAASDIRNHLSGHCIIIARTDAFSAAGATIDSKIGGDIDEAVRRGIAYLDAGADMVWCEFPNADSKSAKAFSDNVRSQHPGAFFAFNISPSFTKDMWLRSELTEDSLASMGYKFRFATYPALLSNSANTYTLASLFAREATSALRGLKSELSGHPMESFMNTVGVSNYQEFEKKYNPGAKEKIEKSEGFKEHQA
ncbi:MAG: hypothetical protein A3H69_05410 [Candidatus Sungbacteria bacterium RIFCSPLOWO2_02_FULL_47_9]|nr:MAG: Isocitrate lyase [Parcubacteria group bacterium GW2011_GWA2_47_10]OHA10442.1 MAG: hypothetical protein A3H69_05410 [Candidatus Sungbacteria bacterium RIFCSPLOWO2_02_FULL_47_9]